MIAERHTRSYSTSAVHTEDKRDTSLLKFTNVPMQKVLGLRCFPKQTFGISEQSPEQFKTKNSLTAEGGYQFLYDNQPNKKHFEYYSQKHFINLDEKGVENPEFLSKFQHSINSNKISFHRRKGKLSDFMDKNGWMAQEFIMMGDERDQTARSLKNKDRDWSIRKAQSKISEKQKTMTLLTTTRKSFKSNHSKASNNLIYEKAKIRQFRNEMATICTDRPNTTEGFFGRKSGKVNSSIRLPGSKKTLEEYDNYPIGEDIRTWKEPNQRMEDWKRGTCGSKFSNPENTGTKAIRFI